MLKRLIEGKMKHLFSRQWEDIAILSADNEHLSFLTPKLHSIVNIKDNDPVTIIYEKEDKIMISNVSVSKINYETNTVISKVDGADLFKNRRTFERFPTSIQGSVENYENAIVFICDVSESGISIRGQKEFSVGQVLIIDTCLNGVRLSLEGIVTRSKKVHNGFFAGIELMIKDEIYKKMVGEIRKEQLYELNRLRFKMREEEEEERENALLIASFRKG